MEVVPAETLAPITTVEEGPQTKSVRIWRDALLYEDCVILMGLLKDDPRLLDRGLDCGPDGKDQTEGKYQMGVAYWFAEVSKSSTWMGRTALHVAARRGCVQLVNKVLELTSSDTERDPRFLECLLSVKDTKYELDALAMTIVTGNLEIFVSLAKASLLCPFNPYHIRATDELLLSLKTGSDRKREQVLKETEELENITRGVLSDSNLRLLDKYRLNKDFNFLKWELYFFHFTFAADAIHDDDCANIRKKIFGKVLHGSEALRCSMSELRDGQGRTALHVAIDESTKITLETFFSLFDDATMENLADLVTMRAINSWRTNWMQARDGGGRMPFHRAVTLGLSDILDDFVANDRRPWTQVIRNHEGTLMGCIDDIFRTSREQSHMHDKLSSHDTVFSVDGLSARNGLPGGSSIERKVVHDAIIGKNLDVVKRLFRYESEQAPVDKILPREKIAEKERLKAPCIRHFRIDGKLEEQTLEMLELAIFVGGGSTVTKWILDQSYSSPSLSRNLAGRHFADLEHRPARKEKPWSIFHVNLGSSFGALKAALLSNKSEGKKSTWSIYHVVAAQGDFGVLKALLNRGYGDPFVHDKNGNTALYHAIEGTDFQHYPHLVDYVSCDQIASERPKDSSRVPNHDEIENRKGCVSLLIQAGLDPWEAKTGYTAETRMESSLPPAFMSWWLEKIEKEMLKFNNALNAISVTAALVATASYVGPLQPPMGYGVNPTDQTNELQIEFSSVKLFSILNTLSFFLAVAAIITAIVPFLPISEQSMAAELYHTRKTVGRAVVFLFPSILLILASFGAANIAVLRSHGFWNSKASTVFGGMVSLIAILVFLKRLLRFLEIRVSVRRKSTRNGHF